jgi:hypothetical protein
MIGFARGFAPWHSTLELLKKPLSDPAMALRVLWRRLSKVFELPITEQKIRASWKRRQR